MEETMSRQDASLRRANGTVIVLLGLVLIPAAACQHRPAEPAPRPAAEPVNDGYTRQPRERVGGSVQSVTAAQVRNERATRVEEVLEGRFPGVAVIRTTGGGFLVQIRGAGRTLASEQPLYVVDGMAVDVTPGRGLDWLSISDIARIDVLRNPAETALYGSRGANGVIVITTKRR
jgi:TonB-dependent starch-binding outer membrane protein SusC